MPRPRLRTKTGCLTCRKRRVKCGEERASCHRCLAAGRQCDWPSTRDFYDRRHRAHADLSRLSPLDDMPSDSNYAALERMRGHRWPRENPTALTMIRSHMDFELVHYYIENLMSLLLLPNVHSGFYSDYRSRVVSMMLHCQSVKCAVLACCASNKYMLSTDVRYQQAALEYYSRAVGEVNVALAALVSARQSPTDQLLTTVEYLYIYALWGPDAVADAPEHVAGAMQLLTLRYEDRASPLSMTRPFDRITAESVLYQAFLLSMRHPFAPNFHVDMQFLARTEKMLNSLTFLDTSAAENSPVLGAPLSLYRLILSIIETHNSAGNSDPTALARMRAEMEYWETAAIQLETPGSESPLTRNPHADTVTLYILAASLFLDWITAGPFESQPCMDSHSLPGGISQQHAPESSQWQVAHAVSILRRPSTYESWTRCFLGSWPMLIFGYAVDTPEDVVLIKQVLSRMRQRMGYGEIQRILDELDIFWRVRKIYPGEGTASDG